MTPNPPHSTTITPRTQLACAFLQVIKNSHFNIDLSQPNKWLDGAIIASGGAGNPAGSSVAVTPLARRQFESIARRLVLQLENEPTAGHCTFERIFLDTSRQVLGSACLGGADTLFTFGRAQKLINILLKYCYAWYWCHQQPSPAFGPLDWVERWSHFFHVPVDRFTMRHLAARKHTRWLAVSGTYLVPWKSYLDEPRYYRIQDAIHELAKLGGYDDALHYEMHNIWKASGSDDDDSSDEPAPEPETEP